MAFNFFTCYRSLQDKLTTGLATVHLVPNLVITLTVNVRLVWIIRNTNITTSLNVDSVRKLTYIEPGQTNAPVRTVRKEENTDKETSKSSVKLAQFIFV